MTADFQPPLTRAGEPCKLCSKFGKPCRPEHGEDEVQRTDENVSFDPREYEAGKTAQAGVGVKSKGREWLRRQDPWLPIEGRCNGRKTRVPGLCRHGEGWGVEDMDSGRCKKHGGALEVVKKHQRGVIAERACREFGVPVPRGPQEALLGLVAECVGNIEYYRSRVIEITGEDPEALTWGVSSHREGFGPEGPVDVTKRSADVNTWLKLYHEAQERLRRVARDAARAGVEERQVTVIEEQGRMIAETLRGALEDAGVAMTEALRSALRERLLQLHERGAIEGEVVDDDG